MPVVFCIRVHLVCMQRVNPLQIGGEIYGHAGLEADAEIQELMLASLALANISEVRLDLVPCGSVARFVEIVMLQCQNHEVSIICLVRVRKTCPALKELTTKTFSPEFVKRYWICQIYMAINRLFKKPVKFCPNSMGLR